MLTNLTAVMTQIQTVTFRELIDKGYHATHHQLSW